MQIKKDSLVEQLAERLEKEVAKALNERLKAAGITATPSDDDIKQVCNDVMRTFSQKNVGKLSPEEVRSAMGESIYEACESFARGKTREIH